MWVCEPTLNKSISVPYSPLVLLNMSLVVFQSQTFWRLSLHSDPKVWHSDVRHEPLGTQGEDLDLWDPSRLWVATWGWEWWYLERLCLCLSYPPWCDPFIICCEGAVQLVFRSFFRGNCSICSCIFGVFMGRGEFRCFMYHLGPCSWLYFKLLQISIYQ